MLIRDSVVSETAGENGKVVRMRRGLDSPDSNLNVRVEGRHRLNVTRSERMPYGKRRLISGVRVVWRRMTLLRRDFGQLRQHLLKVHDAPPVSLMSCSHSYSSVPISEDHSNGSSLSKKSRACSFPQFRYCFVRKCDFRFFQSISNQFHLVVSHTSCGALQKFAASALKERE